MTLGRGLARGAALGLAAALAGCGFGAGPSSSGTATLTVTRDYGSRSLVDATDSDPAESDTVIRLLDREADISTRYGGGFVQSIDGLAGAERAGRRYDWFFYVNGIESAVGAADVRVRGGDRIWWDYRDWTSAMRVPAVVGSWPEPFAQASSDPSSRVPVRVECAAPRPTCATVADRLSEAGVHPTIEQLASHGASTGGRSLVVLVGPWRALRREPVASLRGPAATGVFATFEPASRSRSKLVLSDPQAEPRCEFGAGAGLVAAVEASEGRPAWVVTGTDETGVRRAADALDDEDLRDRYAIATPSRGASLGVPVAAGAVQGGPCAGGGG